jgi:hypothetical protein
MTIKWVGKNIECLAADTKPAAALVPVNTQATETDTHDEYINNGSAWVLYRSPSKTETLTNKTTDEDLNTVKVPTGGWDYAIYRSGTTTKCRDMLAGTTVSSSSTAPEVPIQFALTNSTRKAIYIAAGTYQMSGSFAGLTMSQVETRLYMNPGALIRVAGNYAGSVFILAPTGAGLSNCIIDGGRIDNDLTGETFAFTAYDLVAGLDKAVLGCRISNTYIRSALNCLRLKTTAANGWINSNIFENLYMDRFVNGVNFEVHSGAILGSGYGTNANHFRSLIIQMSPSAPSQYGVKEVWGWRNQFDNVECWDPPFSDGSAKRSTISAMAWQTIINGGWMYDPLTVFFRDLGRATLVQASDASIEPHINPYTGSMPARHSHGDGVLSNIVDSGTRTWNTDTTLGYFRRWTSTGATQPAGFMDTTQGNATFRLWSPYFRIRLRAGTISTTNTRLYVGFKSSTTVPTGIDPLNALHGWMIGYKETDSNYQVVCNDGTGVTLFADTGVPKTVNPVTIELFMDETVPRAAYSINTAHPVFLTNTATFPGSTAPLYLMAICEGTDGARTLDLFDAFINARRTN